MSDEIENPYAKRLRQRGSNGHGKLSEKRVAKSLKAQLTPNSGALTGAKGDARQATKRLGKVLLECKSTIHGTMSLDLGWLVKIATEALQQGATPALTVSFVNPDGKAKHHGDWVMIPKYTYQELVDE